MDLVHLFLGTYQVLDELNVVSNILQILLSKLGHPNVETSMRTVHVIDG
jgi:hypothetical protein